MGSSETKLRICFKAKDKDYRNIYLIYSVEGSWLANQRSNPPTLNRDAVIFGYEVMGCGVYDSKIVLAGKGLSLRYYDHSSHDGFVTYDMRKDVVSYKPFLPLCPSDFDSNVKPLVFQLNLRLYVYYHNDIVNFCSPAIKTDWNISRIGTDCSFYGAEKCSCLVIGNSCCISAPCADVTYIHHSNYNEMCESDNLKKHSNPYSDDMGFDWMKHSDASLPFSGQATFYHQDGFDDFVIIYFENGVVRVFLFDFFSFGDSQVLFAVDSCTIGGTMHGYFADFGNGCYCLTAFNKSLFYLYTFKITRYGKQSDPLKVQAKILSRYNFEFDYFCTEGNKIEKVLGCFAP